jgi:hypothetical protein
MKSISMTISGTKHLQQSRILCKRDYCKYSLSVTESSHAGNQGLKTKLVAEQNS